MSKRMGIRMSGCEQPLEDLIKQHVAAFPVTGYTLIEIGSAGCVTLRAFADILKETCPPKSWRAIGFDLTLDKAWSVNMDEVRQSFHPVEPFIMDVTGVQLIVGVKGMSLVLLEDPRTYLRDVFPLSIDFAFIDGSHGKSCGLDFQAIEPKVAKGGLVVFHDYGEAEQGTDWQQIDNEFINVRTYVHRLGLTQPTNRLRKGWRWVGEIKGSRHWNGDGNSCAVVQRTDEPLEADAPGLD